MVYFFLTKENDVKLEVTSCQTPTFFIDQIPCDWESGNTSRPTLVGDKRIAGFNFGGSMENFYCRKGDVLCERKKSVSVSLGTGKMTIEKKKTTWVWYFLIALVMILVAIFLSSCADIALASELTASYYTTEGLIKDGQWAITKGRCADGSLFNDMGFTVASCDYPLHTRLRITRGDKSVMVTVTDRTNRRFKGKRIDLTPAVFKMLSPTKSLKEGLLKVNVESI